MYQEAKNSRLNTESISHLRSFGKGEIYTIAISTIQHIQSIKYQYECAVIICQPSLKHVPSQGYKRSTSARRALQPVKPSYDLFPWKLDGKKRTPKQFGTILIMPNFKTLSYGPELSEMSVQSVCSLGPFRVTT